MKSSRPIALLVLMVICGQAGPLLAYRPEGPVQERPSGYFTGAYIPERFWDEAAEDEFSAWIQAIGMAREKKGFRLGQGLLNPEINPLYSEGDKEFQFKTDCSNFPYALRAYFAIKTKRPLSFIGFTWKRYTATNVPKDIKDFSQYKDPARLYYGVMSTVNSGHYRMDATLEATDTYPIEITPHCLRPGVVYYDPNGHLLVVYRVDRETGEIFFLDSHPDGTLTRKTFNPSMAVGSARFGGGFRAWRQYQVEVFNADPGAFRISRDLNAKARCYSATEQYQWTYLVEGEELTYHEWVRHQLSGTGLLVDPLVDFPKKLEAYCQSIQDRIGAVNEGLTAGIPAKKHPGKLPFNIYGAEGEWEDYSSPGRDTRLRFEAKELRDFLVKTLTWAASGNKRLAYQGTQEALYADYERMWQEAKEKPLCQFAYTNSEGKPVAFTLDDFFNRLWKLSFDPYHCPELRWGAPLTNPDGTPGTEFSTCPSAGRKLGWYKEEQILRNRHTRLLDRGTQTHRGPAVPVQANVTELLECYRQKKPDFATCNAPPPPPKKKGKPRK